MYKCCVIGLGYIGLPTAAILAQAGNKVIGIDIKPEIIENIKLNNIDIVEEGLKELVSSCISKNMLEPKLKPECADVFIITVPTPIKIDQNTNIPEPNIEFVLQAIESIIPYLSPGNLLLIESTCPVGTTTKICEILTRSLNSNLEDIYISYCPERVIPGNIINELINNDRVIGGINLESSKRSEKFYRTFCKGKLHLTSAATAEMVKLVENSYRDLNIAFANELSIICDKININVKELISLANNHPRVNILDPGCGVGGHCIAVDPWFIASKDPVNSKLIQLARWTNDYKSEWVLKKIKEKIIYLQNKIARNPKVGCLGITFKPDVDDIRGSAALKIVKDLIDIGTDIMICEPNLKSCEDIKLNELEDVLKKSDFIICLVAHKEFKNIDFTNIEFLDICGITFKI